MLDIRRIRSDLDSVKAAIARRGEDTSDLDEVFRLDREQRELMARRDEIRAQVKNVSREVGQLRRDGRTDEASARQDESRRLGEEEKQLDAEAAERGERIRQILLRTPNIPSPDAPDGAGEDDNVVLRVEGYDPDGYEGHQRIPHWEFAVELGLLDTERATKLSGSMFTMFRGAGATLARALVQYGLDSNADAYEEIRPPSIVRTDTMVSTGQLPKFAEEAYQLERDDLWAIPTAEVPLTSLAKDEILEEEELPVRLMAYTPCYRREAGSAGRDTRGLLRVHEFDKVEILAYATEDQAPQMHEELLERAERVIAELGLAYRIVDIATGDMNLAHHRSWDIEVYAPGTDRWLEVSSVSWFSDYQARRANIRYRPKDEKGTKVVHTLNGSALAVPRVWAALVETNRRSDGSIDVPQVLRRYMRDAEVIP